MAHAFSKICGVVTAVLIAVSGQALGDLNSMAADWCQWYQNYCVPGTGPSCNKLWIGGDLLYWRAIEDGLGCDPIEIHDRWHLGFRAGLGIYNNNTNWSLDAYWTHFNEDTDGHQKGCRRQKNDAHWQLNYNVLDAFFSLKCCQSTCFTLNPFIGVRYAQIDQKLRTETHNKKRDNRLTDTQKFRGVGPEVGVSADYDIGCGFSLYGNAAGAILYGSYHLKCEECKRNRLTTCQSVLDVGLGIRTQLRLCAWSPVIQLGWEHHRYFDYNHIGCSSDLCLDGVIFSGSLDF